MNEGEIGGDGRTVGWAVEADAVGEGDDVGVHGVYFGNAVGKVDLRVVGEAEGDAKVKGCAGGGTGDGGCEK